MKTLSKVYEESKVPKKPSSSKPTFSVYNCSFQVLPEVSPLHILLILKTANIKTANNEGHL